MAEQSGRKLQELSLEELRSVSPLFEADVFTALDITTVVARRKTEGGTAPERVAEQLTMAKKQLELDQQTQ
jgi:argininosuccinate lyase